MDTPPDVPPPLFVDLDGTLTPTDLLYETLLAYLGRKPWMLPACALWLAAGRAQLKRRLAERTNIPVESLPYNREVIDWIRAEKGAGRKAYLVSGSDELLVRRVAAHLGLFDAAIGSDGVTNRVGAAKLEAIRRLCPGPFDYCADSRTDFPVWRECREAMLVNPSAGLRREAERAFRVGRIFTVPRAGSPALDSLRPVQWVKNLLIFLPLVTSHRIGDPGDLASAFRMFIAFSLVASCIYVVNDVVDVDADRMHPRKSLRPFASGRLPLVYGVLIPVLLAALAALVAAPLPAGAGAVLALYAVLALVYSFRLKRLVLLDVMTLALLYTLRIVAGHAATGIPYSPWLLSFAVFAFFSLAFCKRVSELHNLHLRGGRSAPGRGYGTDDRLVVTVAGVASGFAACIIFLLYLGSDAVLKLYGQPELLWLLVPAFLYWICRIWILSGRGQMDEDPIIFALRDPGTYVVIAWCGAWLLLAAHQWFPPIEFAR